MPAKLKSDDAAQASVPKSRYLLFLLIAGGGCAADLLTKTWVFGSLGMPYIQQGSVHPPVWLIDGIFGFETNLNEGALFGIGQGRSTLFAALSIVAIMGITYWLFVVRAAHDRLLTATLGMITGGILGNLYDRLGLPALTWAGHTPGHEAGQPVYAVRDWLHFKIDAWNFDWPIFNLADSMLVCGAAMLVLLAVIETRQPGQDPAKAPGPAKVPEPAKSQEPTKP